MTTTAQAVSAVLDPERLSDMLGHPARVGRLRVKPDVSLIFSLTVPGNGTPVGWGRLLWPAQRHKADKASAVALRHGLRTQERDLGQGLLLQVGTIATDPRLVRHLATARAQGLLPACPPPESGEGATGAASPLSAPTDLGGTILRYNPLRRLVLHVGQEVVRASAKAQDLLLGQLRLVQALVPVPAQTRDLRERPGAAVHVSASEHLGDGDLQALPDSAGARRAGAALAQLHSCARAPFVAPPSCAQPARTHAQLLDHLAPWLAPRVRALGAVAPCLGQGGAVLSHGDFSPDQVLTSQREQRVWLTDFERLCLAPPALDLGSFTATAHHALSAALVEGYEAGGGRVPPQRDLLAGQVHARLSRLLEPLRHADPGWQESVSEELTDLEELCAST